MFWNDNNYTMILSETDGIFSARLTGSQIETIKKRILEEYMSSPESKIPGDFFFVYRPASGAQFNNILSSQESFIFLVSGTETAKKFIIEKCGIEI